MRCSLSRGPTFNGQVPKRSGWRAQPFDTAQGSGLSMARQRCIRKAGSDNRQWPAVPVVRNGFVQEMEHRRRQIVNLTAMALLLRINVGASGKPEAFEPVISTPLRESVLHFKRAVTRRVHRGHSARVLPHHTEIGETVDIVRLTIHAPRAEDGLDHSLVRALIPQRMEFLRY